MEVRLRFLSQQAKDLTARHQMDVAVAEQAKMVIGELKKRRLWREDEAKDYWKIIR